ncbi:hypothetical protein D3C87_1820950 [compost metagenome]
MQHRRIVAAQRGACQRRGAFALPTQEGGGYPPQGPFEIGKRQFLGGAIGVHFGWRGVKVGHGGVPLAVARPDPDLKSATKTIRKLHGKTGSSRQAIPAGRTSGHAYLLAELHRSDRKRFLYEAAIGIS